MRVEGSPPTVPQVHGCVVVVVLAATLEGVHISYISIPGLGTSSPRAEQILPLLLLLLHGLTSRYKNKEIRTFEPR